MFLDLEKCTLEVLVYGYCGCFNGFSRIGGDRKCNSCQCFETICMQKKKKRRKVYVTGMSEVDVSVQ